MYASIQLHCLDSHTKKSRFSSTHSHALLPVRQGHSVLRCCSARERREWEWSLFGVFFVFFFFVLPGNSVRMLPAFRQGMRPFPGMHLSCALFLDRISTWWAREIVRRSLFFLYFFHLARFSLAVGLIDELDFADKKLRSSFLRLIRDREYLCAGKGSFFHTI